MTATIEASGLEKRYGTTRALDGLDLVAEPGQVARGARAQRRRQDAPSSARSARCCDLDGGTLRVAGVTSVASRGRYAA